MNKIALNIGLGNNPVSVGDIKDMAEHRLKSYIIDSRLDTSEYNGVPEITLIILLDTGFKPEMFHEALSRLAKSMNQESIAYVNYDEKIERLAYSDTYTGDKQKFNWEYFVEL